MLMMGRVKMSVWGQLGFQDGGTPLADLLISFYDYSILVLCLVISLVSYVIFTFLFNMYRCKNISEVQEVEIVWTVLPSFILFFLAFPSLRLLYLIEESCSPLVTVKAVGHQWYWSYEYQEYDKSFNYDSYMIPTLDLETGSLRLLEVDNRLVLPIHQESRVLVTAADVIHSWAVPSLGVKVDAIPGRLNQVRIRCPRSGIYVGQCSELCGSNHRFIPIGVEVVRVSSYVNWLCSKVAFKGC